MTKGRVEVVIKFEVLKFLSGKGWQRQQVKKLFQDNGGKACDNRRFEQIEGISFKEFSSMVDWKQSVVL